MDRLAPKTLKSMLYLILKPAVYFTLLHMAPVGSNADCQSSCAVRFTNAAVEHRRALSVSLSNAIIYDMPFHHSRQNSTQNIPSLASALGQTASAWGSVASPSTLRQAGSSTNADDRLTFANDAAMYGAEEQQQAVQSQRLYDHSAPPPTSSHHRVPSNAPPLQGVYTPQQSPYSAAPAFNVQQATPQGSQSSSVVPSNMSSNLPNALQPAAGASRSVPSTSHSMHSNAPPIQNNAQQYTNTQTPSRSNTLHSHSRSSPAGMDGSQKYIPFNQTPTQTPVTSNPKAYNLSHTHTPAGPSHSPLNLTDIRSRTVSDVNDSASGTAALFSYSETATNSNYLAPFATYAYDWCKWPVLSGSSGAGKMAVGSYLEDPHNFIQILDTHITQQEVTSPGAPHYGLEYTKVAEATCAYPVTRILWEPPSSQKQDTDLLATSGDHLRLWSLPGTPGSQMGTNINRSSQRDQPPQKLQPLALLSNSKTPEHTAPLTSLDWNTLSPKLIITSSIDTTCTIWDIPTLTAKTQLIAHDREVFDVRFCAGSVDVFVSCGADGSVRMFDLRSLEHSTIIYEPAEKAEKCKIYYCPLNPFSPYMLIRSP